MSSVSMCLVQRAVVFSPNFLTKMSLFSVAAESYSAATLNNDMNKCQKCGIKVESSRAKYCSRVCWKQEKVSNSQSLVGKKFGEWVVESFEIEGKNTIYNCRCSCGVSKKKKKENLLSDKIQACRACVDKSKISKSIVPKWFFSIIQKNAKLREIEFNVSREDIEALFTKQNGKCRYTGWSILISHTNDRSATTASLDRIDSNLPYVIENLQWVHKDINMMKNHYDEAYFYRICEAVISNK